MEITETMDTKPDNSITAFLPSEDMLKKISFRSSYGKSLNKLHLTDSLLNIVIADSGKFYNDLIREDFMFDYIWRIKSKESIVRKYHKGIVKGLRFNTVFNDLIGIRMKVSDYSDDYPDYFRIADMRKGKKNYDGYKAVHLYYQLDKFHYQIEIQLWSDKDYHFNLWSHELAYKTVSDSLLARMRILYDNGIIKSKSDFMEVLHAEQLSKR